MADNEEGKKGERVHFLLVPISNNLIAVDKIIKIENIGAWIVETHEDPEGRKYSILWINPLIGNNGGSDAGNSTPIL